MKITIKSNYSGKSKLKELYDVLSHCCNFPTTCAIVYERIRYRAISDDKLYKTERLWTYDITEQEIAEIDKLSISSVRRHLKLLCRYGLIERIIKGKTGIKSRYRLVDANTLLKKHSKQIREWFDVKIVRTKDGEQIVTFTSIDSKSIQKFQDNTITI